MYRPFSDTAMMQDPITGIEGEAVAICLAQSTVAATAVQHFTAPARISLQLKSERLRDTSAGSLWQAREQTKGEGMSAQAGCSDQELQASKAVQTTV